MKHAPQLAFAIDERPMWQRIDVEDPRGAALADRHYSRQTIGARGYMPPGLRFALWYDEVADHAPDRRAALAPRSRAGALDPVGNLRWRNTIFRNESPWLTSWLALRATEATFATWRARYRRASAGSAHDGDRHRFGAAS